MTSGAVHALADYLAAVDADWRASQGYTGAAIHRRAYWLNMAARILSDGTKALATKPKIEEIANRERGRA